MILKIALGIVLAYVIIAFVFPLVGIFIELTWDIAMAMFSKSNNPVVKPPPKPFPGWKPLFIHLFTGNNNKKALKGIGYVVGGFALYMVVILVIGFLATK